MVLEDDDFDDLYWAVKSNDEVKVGKVLDAKDWDLCKHYGNEGSLVNIAIKNSVDNRPGTARVLAQLLGVTYSIPNVHGKVTLPEDRDILLSDACDADGSLPLTKASAVGSLECVKLLIHCGADVNRKTKAGLRAIDHSLDQEDSRITLLLLREDSLFPKKEVKLTRWKKLQSLIEATDDFRLLFEKRDFAYRALCDDQLDENVKSIFESGWHHYYVDGEGASALYKAGREKKHEAWAYLLEMGLRYGSPKEEEEVNEIKSIDDERFNRALERVFHKAEGCHVMKMVSKSLMFGKEGDSESLGKRFEALYRSLDEDEYTKVLLRVLQDVPGFEVVFDFGATNVTRMRAKECGRKIHGVTDFQRNRVYVGAMETQGDDPMEDNEDAFSHSDIISNLAHELAHEVMNVVYQNYGLPYREGELMVTEVGGGGGDVLREGAKRGRQAEYDEIVSEVMSPENITKCDAIIQRVKKSYSKDYWGQELIVRVPEMVAKYKMQSDDSDEFSGVERLEIQAPKLLCYYINYVLPECNKYIKRNFASDRITLRAMTDYQNLLSSYQEDQIEVNKDIVQNFEFHTHNKLRILKVSNLPLAHSHIVAKFKKRVFFVDWTNFVKCNEMFISGLMRREFDLLAVTWDMTEAPKLCRGTFFCSSDICLAKKFGYFTEWVVILLHRRHDVLMNAKVVEYNWEELSSKTQEHILAKNLNFGGKVMTVKKVIQTLEGVGLVELCAHKYFLPMDIAYFLEEKHVHLSKPTAWPTEEEEDGRIFLNYKECFIQRSLCRRRVDLNGEIIEKNQGSYFFVSNTDLEHLLDLGIDKQYLSPWSQNTVHKISARCYVLDQDADKSKVYDIFENIVKCHSDMKTEGRLYFLKFKDGVFFLVRSSDFRVGILKRENEGEPVESFIHSHIVERLLESSEFTTEEPIVIADNPGCGKSVYLSKLAMDIKKNFPDSWVSFIELSVKEQQKHLESLQRFQTSVGGDVKCIMDLLYEMVRSGDSSFERKLFDHFAHRHNKIFALFDGLDEICPKYKEGITAFLKALKIHTGIKIVVTTRLHEKNDLEKSLDAVSYALVPFSTDDQVKFLGNYWNAMLKKLPHNEKLRKFISMRTGVNKFLLDETRGEDISSFVKQLEDVISKEKSASKAKIGKYVRINFEAMVRKLIEVGDVFAEGPEQFTQTPLHVQMAGLTIYEDSFNIGRTRNLGHLYIRFFELKMKIFTREKARTSGSAPAETLTKMGQKMASSVLENLSANSFQENKVYGFKRNDMLVALSIGLVTESTGMYHFVHRSFGEFFFAKWLLRKAKKKHVTRFWFQKLFLEEWLSRVRFFLEDILHLLSEGVLSSDNDNVLLTQERCLLNGRALPEFDTLQAIRRCLYAHVLEGQDGNLMLLMDSFGEEAVKMMLDDQKSVDLGLPADSRIAQAIDDSISLYKWKLLLPKKYTNTFTFSTYCLDKLTNLSTKKYIGFIRSMLGLIDQFNLTASMKELITENGLCWLFPPHVFFDSRDDKSTSAYISEMVTFFRDHMDVFGDSLIQGINGEFKDTFYSIGNKDFHAMSLLVDSMFTGLDFVSFLLEETSVIFRLWMETVWHQTLEAVKSIWGYLEGKLVDEVHRLKYLQRKNGESLTANALLFSSYNEDPRVIEFIWDVVTSHFKGPGEDKSWMFESFDGYFLNPPFESVHRGFYKFLDRKMESGFLTVEEAAHLLLSKHGHHERHHLLDFQPNAFPNSILSFYDFLHGQIKGCVGEIVPHIKCPLLLILKWMVFSTSIEMEDDLKLRVEKSFESIISEDEFGMVCPLPQEIGLNKQKNIVDHAIFFKANIVVLNEKLSLDFQHQGKEFVVRHLSHPGYDPVYLGRQVSDRPFANILHHVISFRNIPALRYICSVLMKFITQEDMKRLFLEVDFLGKTILHNSVDHDEYYKGLIEVAGKLLGESGVAEIKGVRDHKGNLVQDIISKREAEDAELLFFIEEFNAGK